MCHYCGGELGGSEDDRAENRNPVKSEGEHFSESCRFCREMQESQLLRQKGMNRAVTPSITPTSSFSSSERSSSSDFSVDGIPYDRGNEEECSSRSTQEDMDSTENRKRELKVKGLESRTHSSNTLTEISDRSIHGDVMRDVQLSQADSQESKENNVQNMVRSSDQELEHDNNQLDAHIWEPPEAEISEDESEGDVTDIDDDDDECCDGTKWSKSSFHGDSKDKNSKSLNLKEEKRRAVQEDINRKFRVFVSQLLKSLDVSSSTEFGENWIDIVTGLSWEAASLLKAVIDGKPVDPNAYIKVKCLATGSPSDSRVFRGLVFKKHAAHKHMPTKYERPRILLVQGVLGQSTSGLSSFKSMVQDKDYVKPVVDMIEGCHPNVILVEKSVSRDVQESILGKGITLVFDMKLHRLQRIARCTGSPIVSFDTLSSQKLKHCDSLRIEKIVEEHNVAGEGGKKPSKTLMFLEGCPTRLGCTILLKGSHSDELKRVKEVVQCAVALAYHLTLETSFLVDQQTMLSTVPPTGVTDAASEKKFSITETDKLSGSGIDDSTAESGSTEIDIPIANGFHEQSSYANGNTNGNKAETLESNGDSVFSYEPYNPAVFVGFSSLSASIKKAFEERVPSRSLSRYFGLVENPEVVPASRDVGISDNCDFEAIKDTAEDTVAKDAKEQHLLVDSGVPVDAKIDGRNGEQAKMDTETTALDSQSILVLVSRRNALKGIICDQNHFSHIMFYKNFDVPLGKFLRDMFNQGSQCNTCEELPEAHVYYYAHHSKQLTIQIKRLPSERSLPGEAKGQLWMWSRCCKCKTKDGIPNSTKRVLISTAARSLSFGKFLELSFSEQSLLSRTSSCGHSFERDFLHFFGLGSMVAMFRYSPVTTYTVSLPPQKLELGNSVKTGWLEKEFQNVFTKGISLFEEVASSLKQLRSHLASSSPNNQSLSDVEEMLKEERSQFEENIKNSFDKAKSSGDVSHKLLGMNRMRWELLLQASVWDRRLHSMALPNWMISTIAESERTEQELTAKMDDSVGIETNAKASATNGGFERNEPEGKDIPIYGASVQDDQTEVSNVLDDDKMQTLGISGLNTYHDSNDHTAVIGRLENNEEADRTIPITRESLDSRAAVSNGSHISGRQRMNEWFWLPFEELRSRGIKDLEEVYLSKPETINSSAREVLQTMNQIISEESSRLHIALGDDYYSIVSDYEDELSSLIACALALLVKSPSAGDSSDEENKLPLTRSKHGSLEGFLDKDSVNYQHAIPREDSRFMSFDGLTRLEPLAPPRKGLRRKVSFGSIKSLEKCKYSVVCLYSNEFRELRELCCPSEMDYIASLCRCKPWDAKGGKSKAVFAKTLDDRFIIKEIKRTEYESFVKFADNYFKYMKGSYQSGNQTCLAKVLGIYQVTIRQPKNGKNGNADSQESKENNVQNMVRSSDQELEHDNNQLDAHIWEPPEAEISEDESEGDKKNDEQCRQYDLKGALHARLTTTAEDVLLDQNFVNDMNNSPLYISNMSKRILQRAVWNDTSFLNSINVMDYSLLVGVDTEKRELACGIIDYLRQYTWDKQLETWVKSSLVVPKNVLPTVISPKEYKKRFRKFMSTHFMCVPDHWCTQQQQDPPCHLCDTS
ncbi:PREDICTED: putative 1-phosphatidylinositol-3-phosphate 5-kinase FAB1D [Tarenaya hassleriana]|uniref:putative 1-phosphatidylinositol-3-phosphate 5-kinase FAB1D n=1 Tax=Tarenaya hassleriana TaxID=28532 RepID=UPI00053C95CE|nr:PREDICTED: putative 1-phosphatidylinositol-3-phosphate 5-kinase FAB1D [Tarenaya hassleriana]